MKELELNEIKEWLQLAYFFGFNRSMLSTRVFSQMPNQRALRERALRATERAAQEVTEFSQTTRELGLDRLSDLVDILSRANTELFLVATTKTDCSPDFLSKELEPHRN